MQAYFNFNKFIHFNRSECFFQHWGNNKLIYTQGMQDLVLKQDCYWLIEEIAYQILPRLLQDHKDYFYCIRFSVNHDNSAMISIDDGNSNVHFNHPIKWTDFPYKEATLKFYLCETSSQYCLMLPDEY